MMAESEAILRKYEQSQMGVKVKGDVKLGRPSETYDQDIQMFEEKFSQQDSKMKNKLEFYYGPYENKTHRSVVKSPAKK